MQGPKGEMVQEKDMADYKDVEGVKFPSSHKLPMGPMKMSATVETIEVNSGVEDCAFAVQ